MGSGPSISSDISLNTELNAEERAHYQNPKAIRNLLLNSKVIAMVGLSDKPHRPSHFVASYLKSEGYRVIPVNPRATEILGEKAYPDLKSISFPVDIVDIFRKPAEVPSIVEDAIAIGAKAVWQQLKIINLEAAQAAREHGLVSIVDRCVKMEHGRYSGNLHWVGMNTEIISARKAKFI
ncbi:MAG: CoA-binding protein [Bacteroidota bacterium]